MSTTLQPHFEQPLGRLLSILAKGYLHILRTKLQHLDIDRNYYALVVIDSYKGAISQQELALLLDTDKVSIVRVIDYLSEKGYIKRTRKSDDRRKHSLELTEKAILALPEIKQSFNYVNELVLKDLSHSQVTELTDSILKIKNNITENIKVI